MVNTLISYTTKKIPKHSIVSWICNFDFNDVFSDLLYLQMQNVQPCKTISLSLENKKRTDLQIEFQNELNHVIDTFLPKFI